MRKLSPERSKGSDNHEVGSLGFEPKDQFLSVLLSFHRDGLLKCVFRANAPWSDSVPKHRAPPPLWMRARVECMLRLPISKVKWPDFVATICGGRAVTSRGAVRGNRT